MWGKVESLFFSFVNVGIYGVCYNLDFKIYVLNRWLGNWEVVGIVRKDIGGDYRK